MTRMPDPAGHAGHDQLLVAAYAAGDASGADLERAAALVASCPECARLHRDLRALSAALGAAPAPARPRDFRLTAEDAARLSRPTGWRRVLAPFAGARSATGPLAASLAALGLAGLLLGGGVRVDLGLGGSAAPALAPQAAATAAPAALNAGASGADTAAGQGTSGGGARPPAAASAAAVPAPSSAPSVAVLAGPSAAPSAPSAPSAPAPASDKTASIPSRSAAPPAGPTTAPAAGGEAYAAPSGPAASPVAPAASPGAGEGASPLVLGSLVLLVAGVALGLLRLAARRLV